jgi:hypothetical protein
MIRLISALTVSLLLLSGCGDSDPETERGTTAPAPESRPDGADGNPFIADIDADTAYFYTNLRRLPESVSDKMWMINESNASTNRAMLEALSEDDELPTEARALVDELIALATRDGWKAAGLHPNPYYAFFGSQLMPFMRFELSDGAAFGEFMSRVEQGLEQPFSRRDVEGSEVIWFEVRPGLGIAMYHDEEAVTAALVPDDAAFLAQVTGAYDPVEPMTASAVASFNASEGFSAHGSGYLDWRRFIDSMLAEDAPLASLYTEGQLDELTGNPACVAEYGALGEAMPRLSFGYTQLTESEMDFTLRQELSDALATGLSPAARAPVSIDRRLNGLFNLGFAVDLVAAREFARSLVDGWVENPPQCPSFAAIAEQAPEVQQNLNRPIPPVVTNLHGLYLEAMTFDLGENGIPTGGGTLSFFMENPQLLVGMAQMFSPAVAELSLEPGGEPQPVPADALPQLAQLDLQAWIALAENAIGIAIGEDHIDQLSRSIEPTAADDLIMAGNMDFRMMTELMSLAENAIGDIDEEAARGLQAQRAQYEAMAEIYESASFKIRLAEGVEFIGETRLR